VYPEIESPWTNIFGLEKEKEVWHAMKNVLNSRDAELNMRMVVGDKDIPFASAYTIGYRIMQEFLRRWDKISSPSKSCISLFFPGKKNLNVHVI
jgi:uncharacterized protein YjaZ